MPPIALDQIPTRFIAASGYAFGYPLAAWEPPRRAKDHARAVYRAENSAFRAYDRSSWLTKEGCWAFLAEVVESEALRRTYGHVRMPHLRFDRQDGYAWCLAAPAGSLQGRPEISLRPQDYERATILHELAHALCEGDPEIPIDHSRLWIRVYVDLVTKYMGPLMGSMLDRAFRDCGELKLPQAGVILPYGIE